LLPFYPTRILSVARASGGSPSTLTEEVDKYIMILDFSVSSAGDFIEDFDDCDWIDIQAAFFQYLANDAFLKRFSQFKSAARQRPSSLERLVAPANQENLVPLNDHRTYTDDRRFRIFSPHLLVPAQLLWF
jgi:hypothetical protein